MQEENSRTDITPCIKRSSRSDMKVFDCLGANNMSRVVPWPPRCRLIGACVRQARAAGGRVEPEKQGFFACLTDMKGQHVEWSSLSGIKQDAIEAIKKNVVNGQDSL